MQEHFWFEICKIHTDIGLKIPERDIRYRLDQDLLGVCFLGLFYAKVRFLQVYTMAAFCVIYWM